MVNNSQNEYHPDYVTPPGETLAETLDALGMSQTELALRMGRPVKTVNEIIQGKAAITAETALQLEQVVHVPASFWLRFEQNYREFLARLAASERLDAWSGWLRKFPLREMTRRDWLPSRADKRQQVFELLCFFGVASPEAWEEIWKSQLGERHCSALKNSLGAITAWIRQGEIKAQEIETKPYQANAFRHILKEIDPLTTPSLPTDLARRCAEAGIAVVFVEELPGTHITGATQWLTPRKALIQLSARYQTDERLWFTFLHEAAHILLHGKRQFFLDLEDIDPQNREKTEKQANTFATAFLADLQRHSTQDHDPHMRA